MIFPGVYTESVDLALMGSALSAPTLGDITMATVDASGNVVTGTAKISPSTGMALATTTVFTGNVTLSGLAVTSPDNDGISLDVNGDVRMTGIQASNTFTNGIDIDLRSSTITRTLQISNTITTNNGRRGIEVDTINAIIRMADINSKINTNDGLDIGIETGTVRLISIVVDTNGDDGINVDIITGTVEVANSISNGNTDDGISLNIPAEFIDIGSGIASVTNVTVTNNIDDGIRIRELGAIVRDSIANNNGSEGVTFEVSGTVSISNTTARGNDQEGFEIEVKSNSDVILTNLTANENQREGIDAKLLGGGSITVTQAIARQNIDEGIKVTVIESGNITLNDSEAVANGDPSISSDGISLNTETGDIQIRNTSSISNTSSGFALFSSGSVQFANVTVQDNNNGGIELAAAFPSDLIDNLRIVNSLIMGNQTDPATVGKGGITLSELDANGMLIVTGNIIANNANYGLALNNVLTGTNLLAVGNWWGDTSGPGGLGSGQGDSVVANAGSITFTPWIDTVDMSASQASIPAQAGAKLRFQFRDATGTAFLGAGPGNLNSAAPPFRLSTDNGTIETTGFITGDDGRLMATLTQQNSGNAMVMIDGPGTLDGVCQMGGACRIGSGPNMLSLYVPIITR